MSRANSVADLIVGGGKLIAALLVLSFVLSIVKFLFIHWEIFLSILFVALTIALIVRANQTTGAHQQESSSADFMNSMDNASVLFIDNGDGTVTDATNGLMWMRCALGQNWDGAICNELPKKYNWNNAICLQQDFAGHGDWRLPNIDELSSILEKNAAKRIDRSVFPDNSGLTFWSSTPNDKHANWARLEWRNAWCINASTGEVTVTSLINENAVRLIRNL